MTPSDAQLAECEGLSPKTGAYRLDTFGNFSDSFPRVASNGSDTFVTVWNDGASILARLRDRAGEPLESGIEASDDVGASRRHPAVAMAPDGRFVVAWDAQPQMGDREIRVRRFEADGTPAGASVAVNGALVPSSSFPTRPAVDIASNGEWFVVWTSTESTGSDQSDLSIQGRRYDWTGTALTAPTQVNTETSGRQMHPAIDMLPDGRAVVGYHNWQTDEARARRYAANGSPIGNDFLVTTALASSGRTDVAMAPSGAFLVVWYGSGSPGSDPDLAILGRRYSADGTPLSNQFQINSGTFDDQLFPRAAALADGNYLVIWESRDQPGDDEFGIRARFMRADATFVGDEIRINQQTTNSQTASDLAVTDDGTVMTVYYSDNDTSGQLSFEAWGRPFRVPVFGIFCDGFETGDLSRWSNSTP